jgi:hypothetical protein
MNVERVKEFMAVRPFQPFDIKMSDGRLYTVDHPEFVALSRDNSTIFFSTEGNRSVFLDVHHVTGLEVANRASRVG